MTRQINSYWQLCEVFVFFPLALTEMVFYLSLKFTVHSRIQDNAAQFTVQRGWILFVQFVVSIHPSGCCTCANISGFFSSRGRADYLQSNAPFVGGCWRLIRVIGTHWWSWCDLDFLLGFFQTPPICSVTLSSRLKSPHCPLLSSVQSLSQMRRPTLMAIRIYSFIFLHMQHTWKHLTVNVI